MNAFKGLLFLGFAGLTLFSLTVYAQEPNGEEIATQGYFHLRSGRVELCNDQVCDEPSGNNIAGNLFTFTHPGTPSRARLIEWNAASRNDSVAEGSFTIRKDCQSCLIGGYPIHGEIYVVFNVRVEFVPPLEDGENQHGNFQGPFRIVGGSGFYSGIRGQGTFAGTYHDHPGNTGDTWLDFVMLGDARFR